MDGRGRGPPRDPPAPPRSGRARRRGRAADGRHASSQVGVPSGDGAIVLSQEVDSEAEPEGWLARLPGMTPHGTSLEGRGSTCRRRATPSRRFVSSTLAVSGIVVALGAAWFPSPAVSSASGDALTPTVRPPVRVSGASPFADCPYGGDPIGGVN